MIVAAIAFVAGFGVKQLEAAAVSRSGRAAAIFCQVRSLVIDPS
jgi:hypothetical protein